ncbi:MAG: ATP-binding cassette domain-containing protein [Bacteroidota bacterium]
MQLITKNISKNYGKKQVLQDFSLHLNQGIIGLLGPNGAGKSTLMKIWASALRPSSGQLYLDDVNLLKDTKFLRSNLGYLPQDFGVYPNLTGREFLTYLGTLKGLSGRLLSYRVDSLLEAVNLMEVADSTTLNGYSGGMRQRIGISQVLLNDPKLMIFDEPTVGLDPTERIRFREMLLALSKDKIIIVSSHIVSEISSIADQVVIMKKGTLLLNNRVQDSIHSLKGRIHEQNVNKEQLDDIKKKYPVVQSGISNSGYNVRYISDKEEANAWVKDPSLEDVYVQTISNV